MIDKEVKAFALRIEYMPLHSLTPYARNARTHSPDQVAQIAESVKVFGWTNPVLIDEAGGIIAGHGRVMAADMMGMADVPCIRLAHLSATQRRAYALADNKLALNAGWDEVLLAAELDDLLDDGFDLSVIGFAPAEINDLTGTPNTGPADFPEVDENIETQHQCPRCGYEYSGGKGGKIE